MIIDIGIIVACILFYIFMTNFITQIMKGMTGDSEGSCSLGIGVFWPISLPLFIIVGVVWLVVFGSSKLAECVLNLFRKG